MEIILKGYLRILTSETNLSEIIFVLRMEFLKDVIAPFVRTNLSLEWIDGFAPETLLTQKKEKFRLPFEAGHVLIF